MTIHNKQNAAGTSASTAQIITSLSRLVSQQIKEEKEKQHKLQQENKTNKASTTQHKSAASKSSDDIHDYHARKAKHQQAMITKYIIVLKEKVPEMRATLAHLSQMLDEKNFSKVQDLLDRVTEHIEENSQSSSGNNSSSSNNPQHYFDNNALPRFPFEIKEEIEADIHEAQTCYSANAYRACIILCGRILETALLRKYFDVTGRDLLETAPGIGLGKTIAKLQEANVTLDPGLTQQIHLINNVRIFSVHKKQTHFAPSQQQAQAIMLYTFDVLQKIF